MVTECRIKRSSLFATNIYSYLTFLNSNCTVNIENVSTVKTLCTIFFHFLTSTKFVTQLIRCDAVKITFGTRLSTSGQRNRV